MRRESFQRWHIPRDIDGLLLRDDSADQGIRFGSHERHLHDELELHLVTQGRAVFLLGGDRVEADAATMVWVPPKRDHLLIEASPDLARWLLLLRPRVVRRVLPPSVAKTMLTDGPQPICRKLSAAGARALSRLFEEVRSSSRLVPLLNAGIGYAAARAWTAYESARGEPETSTLHPAVARAVRLLQTMTPLPDTVELAERCATSQAHLSKLFSKDVGVSITDYRNRVRMDRFLSIYVEGNEATMMDAALEAGFGSYAQFYRVFQRTMGHPPGAMRERKGGRTRTRT